MNREWYMPHGIHKNWTFIREGKDRGTRGIDVGEWPHDHLSPVLHALAGAGYCRVDRGVS